MAEISFKNFDGQLSLVESKVDSSSTTLRRAVGLHEVKTRSARSRAGSALIQALASVHSIFRFRDVNFFGAGDALYRTSTAIKTGLSGNRLRFQPAKPTTDISEEYLFVAGGGSAFKVDSAGAVSIWGIDAPPDGFTIAKDGTDAKVIETFESAASWTDDAGIGTLADDATQKQVGTNALKVTVAANTRGRFWKSFAAVDLTVYASLRVSPEEDYINVWFEADEHDNIRSISLGFKVGSAAFDAAGETPDMYIYTAEVGDLDVDKIGISSILSQAELANQNAIRNELGNANVGDPDTAEYIPFHRRKKAQHAAGRTKIKDGASNLWTRLKIPKSLFDRSGDGATGWEDITGIRIQIRTTVDGPLVCHFDQLRLTGSVGKQGTYSNLITFLNSTTGHRSNPNPTPVVVEDVERESYTLSNLPTTNSDPQVDTVEIWNTLGDGSVYFKAGEVTLGTATFINTTADYDGMDSSATAVLGNEALRFSHGRPPDSAIDCIMFLGRMWVLNTGSGKVFYSRAGWPEALSDHVVVTQDEEPLLRLVEWNGALFVFSEARVFRLTNTAEPFVFRPVQGVPGTVRPHTVSPSPIGIIYFAADGVRVFNGAASTVAFSAPVMPIFRGETREGIPAFAGVVAAYGREKYVISDETTTLIAGADGTWRVLGYPVMAAHYAPDIEKIFVARAADVVAIDTPSTLTDNGTAIHIDWASHDLLLDASGRPIVKRFTLDINTNDEVLIPYLVLDGATMALPAIQTATRRSIEYAIDREAQVISWQLIGDVDRQVELFEVTIEVYEPKESAR